MRPSADPPAETAVELVNVVLDDEQTLDGTLSDVTDPGELGELEELADPDLAPEAAP